ncbi:hypothetical protein ABVT39_009510 [Epinephelus coioides]
MSACLGPEMSCALPMFHALTGCDTVSSFAGLGKKAAWSTWKSLPQLTDALLTLASGPKDIPDDAMSIIERLRRHDRDGAPSDTVLQDQLLGLAAQALKIYARRNPEKAFAALRQEALLLDAEHGNLQPEVTCTSVNNPRVPAHSQDVSWKETLK